MFCPWLLFFFSDLIAGQAMYMQPGMASVPMAMPGQPAIVPQPVGGSECLHLVCNIDTKQGMHLHKTNY